MSFEKTRRNDSPHRGSIIGTLIVVSTLVGFTMLILVSFFLIRVAERYMEQEWTNLIVGKLLYVDSELRSAEEATEHLEIAEVSAEIAAENRFRTLGTFYLEIIDAEGNPKLRTEGVEKILAETPPFPAPVSEVGNPTVAGWTSPSDRYFLLSTVTVPVEETHRVIRLALDETEARDFLRAYRRTAWLVILVGTTLFGLAVMLITRRAFRPLEEIVHLSERISVDHLDDRIGSRSWPRELTHLAVAFDGMLDRLESSFDRLARFSADIAHELRTPVSNIMGETEVTLRNPRSEIEYRETLASVLEETNRLTRIIESLLFLARAEANREPIRGTEPIEVRKEVDSVVAVFLPRIEERGLRVTVSGQGSIQADRDLLRRALSNLLSNAIQFTREGDAITIEIADSDHDDLRIVVHDTGMGIRPEHLPRVFDRFYRADESRRVGGGSGLGLSIVDSIMQLHRGRVTIESSPGVGTTVTLVFSKS